jgi:glucose-6-phosphate isomerase
VELGKELATRLLPVVAGQAAPDGQDPSTKGLVGFLRAR